MSTPNALMNMKDTVPDVETAVEAWNAYMELCGKNGILNQTDYQKIWVKEKDEHGNYHVVEREFKKKSAWQKLARAFNVDTQIVDKEFQRTKTGAITEAYYCVRARLPNGRCVESDALCNRREKGKGKIKDHDIIATAKTRATNRAIAELIGAGEVSSEEITPERAPQSLPEKEPEMIETSVKEVHEELPEPEPEPEKEDEEPVFVTADVVGEPNPEDDPIRKICIDIKEALEKQGRPVTKTSMKLQVIQLIDDEKLPAEQEVALFDFIMKYCPEEL